MVQVVIRYSLSPFRDWLNRDYGLTTGAHGKNVCRLLLLDVWGGGCSSDFFLLIFQYEQINPHLQGYARFRADRNHLPPSTVTTPHCHNGGVRRSAGRGPRDKPLTWCSRARVEIG